MSNPLPMLRPTIETAPSQWMPTALWNKSLREARWLWLSCAALMVTLHLVRAWITSLVPMSDFRGILSFVPAFVQNMFPVSLEQLATTAGRIATSYDDPIVLLICLVWTFARASDVVSGELGRGTLEMTLAQPISRTGYLLTHSAVTVLGAALLALSAWMATFVAIHSTLR